MKKMALLAIMLYTLLLLSCNNKNSENNEATIQTQKMLQGAWYTTTLETNGQVINTKEHPEALSSFVFKDDKVKLIQLGNNSENSGTFKISNDTVYINDIINNTNVMSIKLDKVTDNNLNITIIGQNVKMMMERMDVEDELKK